MQGKRKAVLQVANLVTALCKSYSSLITFLEKVSLGQLDCVQKYFQLICENDSVQAEEDHTQ